jgi:hypothetical protein
MNSSVIDTDAQVKVSPADSVSRAVQAIQEGG